MDVAICILARTPKKHIYNIQNLEQYTCHRIWNPLTTQAMVKVPPPVVVAGS